MTIRQLYANTGARIMQPGVIHAVFSLEDTIIVGGHFYSKETLSLSLLAGIHEHLEGRLITNTQHLASESILHALTVYYSNVIEVDQMEDGSPSGLSSFFLQAPANKSLMNIVL